MEQSQRHDPDPLTPCEELVDPYPLCKPLILEARSKWDAVVARGGLLRLIQDGTYRVNDPMIQDLCSGEYGIHASH